MDVMQRYFDSEDSSVLRGGTPNSRAGTPKELKKEARVRTPQQTQKLQKTQSTGIFPSCKDLPPEHAAAAFFGTTSKNDFKDHSKAHRSNSVRSSENKVFFKKLMAEEKRQLSEQPMYKSSFCEYGRNYVPFPVKSREDKMLVDMMVQAAKGGGELGPPTKLNSETSNGRFYVVPTKDGRGAPILTGQACHVEIGSPSGETQSSQRWAHVSAQDPKMARAMRGVEIPLRGECACTYLAQVPNKSLYGYDYKESQYNFTRHSKNPTPQNPMRNTT